MERRIRKRVTEGVYNILNPSVYVSMKQEMNDDSLYIIAVSPTQHEAASVSLDVGGREWILYWINNIKTPL